MASTSQTHVITRIKSGLPRDGAHAAIQCLRLARGSIIIVESGTKFVGRARIRRFLVDRDMIRKLRFAPEAAIGPIPFVIRAISRLHYLGYERSPCRPVIRA